MAIIPGGFDATKYPPLYPDDDRSSWDFLSEEERQEIREYWRECELADAARGTAALAAEQKITDNSITNPDDCLMGKRGVESARKLVRECPTMRPVLINGLLRRGETMNIIAAPKTGKSWLAMNLAVAFATGTPWFGFQCEKGKVLIIDNELHRETISDRILKVCEARGVPFEEVADMLFVNSLRGRSQSINDLKADLEGIKGQNISLIIIDAFYRSIPRGVVENDNAAMTGVYDQSDAYAAHLNCAFALIHLTSKGNQSFKSVTDVGSGAGAISRAADTHLILRRHKKPGVIVMEAVVRSFREVPPVCLRRNGIVWVRDDTLDANELAGARAKREAGSGDPKKSKRVQEKPEDFAGKLVELVKEPFLSKDDFIKAVREHYGIKHKTAKGAVEIALERGSIVHGGLKNPPRGKQATKFVQLPAGR